MSGPAAVPFGETGLTVSRLGLGLGAVGDARVSEREAEALLRGALDLGVRFFDAAPSYGAAEERVGRYLARRKDGFVLSTKGGYGAEGAADWTGAAIIRGVDQALARMRLETIDVFHLHSCPLETLRRHDVLAGLEAVRLTGKVRVAAYSGENEELAWALGSGAFGSLQCSVNVFDQRALAHIVPRAAEAGLGVVGKRPLGNAPWRFKERPVGNYADTYWQRMQAMGLDPQPLDWPTLALRFAAHAPGVSTVVVGTRSLEHLRAAAAAVAQGPLDRERSEALTGAFREHDDGWRGQV